MSDTEKVKVALRVRPFNRREIELGTKCVVDMEPQQTMLYHPSVGISGADTPSGHAGSAKKQPKVFAFDHCFHSMDENSPKFCSQEVVFDCLGRELIKHAFGGYNACIFAYGQTGSGKSYTMMGTSEQKGIIPRLCEGLFDSINKTTDNATSFKVEVSYMEIYNEKVRDLLDPKGGKHTLRVREHNILGPYVDDLSILAVSTFKDIDDLMSEGNKSRTVAATNMNSESSRSHAVFNIILTQTLTDLATGVSGEKVSKMSLVDLAGSERAQKTGAVGERLKEGSNINKSLTTLGLVISALADQASGKSKGKFVPYRDSVLTWLLKDNLGGNSKTVMIATLSPAADNYEETLSTLRYADRAKRIVNHAVVNEDPNARIIRELREEVDMLKTLLNEAQSMKAPDLRERLEESEKLMNDMSKTWEQKLIETERIHQERHAALEKMGISVQTSGIKVEQGKYYLVNLNADPSLNELLVYYLKDNTMVGRPGAPTEQDIQLSGLGIMPEHCIVEIDNSDVFLSPLEGARTCVNGRTISSKTRVKHGDRILWGNNHFFRINCPKANSPSAETPEQQQNIDYDFAQQELMMQEMGDDPIQDAIEAMEKQHEEEKAEALEKQRQMYERQMQMLRSQLMSPSTPSQPYPPFFDPFTKMSMPGSTNSNMHPKYQQWAQEREKLFKASLSKLKEEVVRANALVREANFLAQEMGKETEFFVTLQIPAGNLSPNRKRGAFVSEPAILVKRREKGSQIWSMDKFENKIFDMREMYEERKEKGLPMMDEGPPAKGDPFYESQENHNLIGVANIFLEALFYDVKLDYHVPIISQQGEVAGRLHIELSRLGSSLPDRNIDVESINSEDMDNLDEENGVAIGSVVVCRVLIKEARGLPPALSNFVFCQYGFWGNPEPIVIPPQVNAEVNGLSRKRNDSMSFVFDHSKEFTVHVTEEFMEHCTEGALSIEVWGHRSIGFGQNLPGWEIDPVVAKSRSIMDRWTELTRKIETWVEVHEINDQGEYMPVEVNTKAEVLTGGIVQLRQGHSRRILVQVKPVQNSGTLPIICESITHVSIGCVCARSKLQKGLDSYQEEDLTVLREKWSNALNKRREYLDEQLQRTMNKEEKNDTDKDREKSLIDQWVCLTEERNAVLVPAAGSGIPGAPADWDPEAGMEQHIPVIFLDLNAEDMSTPQVKEGMQAAGVNSILPKEHGAKFYTLPFVKNSEKDVTAVVSWDSSIHDSVHLNRVTPNNERVYLILKVVVRLSHPASMELVLRKRICINVYKRQSLTDKLKKRIGKSVMTTLTGTDYFQDSVFSTGVTYEVVSNIPKASEDLEDRESLAQMAASTHEINASDGETYIEKYIRGVSAVESILTLDRLRQEVAIKELLAARGRPLRKSTSVPNIHNVLMKRATSVPNIADILTSPRGLDEQMRTDSLQDLTYGDRDRYASLPKQFPFDFRHRGGSEDLAKELIYGKDGSLLPNKPTGPFSLASPKTGASPQPTKLVKPMKTLVEEQHIRESKPLLDRGESEDVRMEGHALHEQEAPTEESTSPEESLTMVSTSQEQTSVGGAISQEQVLHNEGSTAHLEDQKGLLREEPSSLPHIEALSESITSQGELLEVKRNGGTPQTDILIKSSIPHIYIEEPVSQEGIQKGESSSQREVLKEELVSHMEGSVQSLTQGPFSQADGPVSCEAVSTEGLDSNEGSSQKVSDDDEFAKLKVDKKAAVVAASTANNGGLANPSNATTNDETAYDSDDFTEFESYQEGQHNTQFPLPASTTGDAPRDATMTHSSTNESLTDIQAGMGSNKSFTPSMSSSGYGSQAVSTQTLSSEDSASVRSMSIDDTPEHEGAPQRAETQNTVPKKPTKPTSLDVENTTATVIPTGNVTKDTTPETNTTQAQDNDKESAANNTTNNKTLKPSLSLIDMDVPSNLGTPLQPGTPEGEEEDSEKTLTQQQTNGQNGQKSAGESSEEETKPSESSAGNDTTTSTTVDMYSETAMDELEALAETEVNVSINNASAVGDNKKTAPAVAPAETATTETKMDANANPTSDDSIQQAEESRDKFEETPKRRGSDDKVVRRRSWHEKLDRRSNTVDDSSSSKTETVKLRKGGSIDVTRPGSLKKLRSGGTAGGDTGKASKASPSPVKATYRPMSMPVDHLVSQLEETGDLDNSMEVDDNSDNDDGMSICSFGSRADLHRLGEAAVPSWIVSGEPVIVLSSRGGASKTGTVQFVGTTDFAGGNWVGVALDTADGKNDGSVKGIRYFKCRQRHGIFVRHDKLIMDKKRKGAKVKNVSPSLRRSTGNLSSSGASPGGGGSFMKGTAASNAKHK